MPGPSLNGDSDQVYPRTTREIMDSILRNYITNPGSAKFDLSILMRDCGDKLSGYFETLRSEASDKTAMDLFISEAYTQAVESARRSRDSRKGYRS